MAQEAKKTPLEMAKDKYEIALKAANDALGKNPSDLVAYNAAMSDLDKAEKEYAKLAATAMYAEYAGKPIVEIIKAYSYETLGHREKPSDDKDNPRIIAVDPITKKRQIDLLAFCNHAKLDTHWELTASAVNQLMCLRAATELGADVDQTRQNAYQQYTGMQTLADRNRRNSALQRRRYPRVQVQQLRRGVSRRFVRQKVQQKYADGSRIERRLLPSHTRRYLLSPRNEQQIRRGRLQGLQGRNRI